MPITWSVCYYFPPKNHKISPVFLRICALSKSPLDRCFNPKSRTILVDIVPFPDPGAPRMTILNNLLISLWILYVITNCTFWNRKVILLRFFELVCCDKFLISLITVTLDISMPFISIQFENPVLIVICFRFILLIGEEFQGLILRNQNKRGNDGCLWQNLFPFQSFASCCGL